jgi:hypothetical protein
MQSQTVQGSAYGTNHGMVNKHRSDLAISSSFGETRKEFSQMQTNVGGFFECVR